MSPGASGDPRAAATGLMIHVGPGRIEPRELYRRVQDAAAGAVVQFCGVVRNHHQGVSVVSIEYEAYREMAERVMENIARDALERWNLQSVSAVHRTGHLSVGEIAVCISVASAHRGEAFTACRDILDRVKAEAPIWKLETLQSGDRRWVEDSRPAGSGEQDNE